MDEPPVKLPIRKGADTFEWRRENEWPLDRTRWTKLYLDLSQPAAYKSELFGALEVKNPHAVNSRSYAASSLGSMGSTSAAASQVMGGGIRPGMGISLETAKLSVDTEIAGPLAAVLWVSSTSEDMDLFLTLRNIGPDGNEIMETGQQGAPVPVAKGWLRVSHRELDPQLFAALSALSQACPPALSDAGRDREGRGRNLADLDGVQEGQPHPPRRSAARRRRQRRKYMHYHADYNSGAINTIHAGGDMASYLLPVTPAVDSEHNATCWSN